MRKLLLLFVGVTLFSSCSSDDSPIPVVDIKDVEVLSSSHSYYSANSLGHEYTFTATIRNNTQSVKTGDVSFYLRSDTMSSNVFIYDVTLQANETKTVTEVLNTYIQAANITLTSVKFVEN